MEEYTDEKFKRPDEYSHSQISDTPRASLIDQNSDFFLPMNKKKNRQISFVSPQRIGLTQSFATSHTRSGRSVISPPMRSSLTSSQELKSKEFSLKKLDKQLNKITEEFATARNSERFIGNDHETDRDREKETCWDTGRELKSYNNTERSTAARHYTDDDLEVTEFPTLKWCAFCARETCVELQYKASNRTFLSSLGIFAVGGICGCFLLPYMTNACKDIQYICHICKHEIRAVDKNLINN